MRTKPENETADFQFTLKFELLNILLKLFKTMEPRSLYTACQYSMPLLNACP